MTRKTLVLLPGLDGTEIFFGPLLAHLPPWIEPVVVTYPSSGSNAYEELLPVVERAVDGLADFAVLGWSFGGPLALMLAARRPAQVSAVVLASSFVTPPRPKLVPWRFAAVGPVIATVRALRRTRLLLPGQSTSAFREAKARTWRRVDSWLLAKRVRAVLGVDARDPLAQCSASMLYIAATRDEVIPRASLDQVLAIAPRTQVTNIDGPHFALFTNPGAAAARIADFLAAPGAARTPVYHAGSESPDGDPKCHPTRTSTHWSSSTTTTSVR